MEKLIRAFARISMRLCFRPVIGSRLPISFQRRWATTPWAGDNIYDPVANANAAAWMWSVGRRGEWVC